MASPSNVGDDRPDRSPVRFLDSVSRTLVYDRRGVRADRELTSAGVDGEVRVDVDDDRLDDVLVAIGATAGVGVSI